MSETSIVHVELYFHSIANELAFNEWSEICQKSFLHFLFHDKGSMSASSWEYKHE